MTLASTSRTLLRTAVAATLALALAGCATGAGTRSADATEEVNDPLEVPNRFIFAVNEAADVAIIRPAAEVYRAAFPDPVRSSVQNILRNLLAPLTIANELLQGDMQGAQLATGRFMTNTILGLGGVLDVATEAGIPYTYEDFGQTLAVWGVGEGPYIVLPLLGRSNLRDATGLAVDSAADPFRLWASGTGNTAAPYVRGSAAAVDHRSRILTEVDDLRRNSLDFYATARSLYRQQRAAEISDGKTAASTPEFPDFDTPATVPAR